MTFQTAEIACWKHFDNSLLLSFCFAGINRLHFQFQSHLEKPVDVECYHEVWTVGELKSFMKLWNCHWRAIPNDVFMTFPALLY